MLHSRGWMSPPTRREITLLLFSLTVFVLSYNLETSLQLVGVNPSQLSSGYLSTIGLGTKDPGFEPDGRRPKEWRDALENLIFGEWQWEAGKVSGVERPQAGGGASAAAVYNVGLDRAASRNAAKTDRALSIAGGVTPHEQFVKWGNEVPVAKATAHVPGFTILDNVIMANGTFFLVTDEPLSLPALGAIASSAADSMQPPRLQDWQILSREEAATTIGSHGGRLYGTTWLSADASSAQDPYTLLSLYRTHNALSITPPASDVFLEGDATFGNNVSAPLRWIFPHVPTFSSPHLPPVGTDAKAHPPPRLRSYIGTNPLLQKAVLPALGTWYAEDWDDVVAMAVPWVLDRVVVSDRGAAERGREHWADGWAPAETRASGGELRRRAEDDGKPAWAAPFVGLRASDGWWAPARAALLRYVRLAEPEPVVRRARKAAGQKPIVTYVSMQQEPRGAGARLVDADHDALLSGLGALVREGVLGEAYVVRGNGSVDVMGWEWEERMRAIARSSIVLGPYGYHLFDSIFMDPRASSPTGSITTADPQLAPLLMEFFPGGTFVCEQEFAVRSLGMRYMAWWNDRKFTGNSLPPVMHTDGSHQHVSVDAKAVLQAIREEAARIIS